MLAKSFFITLLLSVSLHLSTAEEKFDSHQTLVKYGVREFVLATYDDIEKSFDLTEKVLNDLKALDTKTDDDTKAIEKLEDYMQMAQKTKGTPMNDDTFGDKLDIIIRTLFLVGEFKTKESEYIMKSQAVKDIAKKYDFETARKNFFKSFNAFLEKFMKTVDDFLSYATEEQIFDIRAWSKKMNEETEDTQKLHNFLYLFVNIGQFNN